MSIVLEQQTNNFLVNNYFMHPICITVHTYYEIYRMRLKKKDKYVWGSLLLNRDLIVTLSPVYFLWCLVWTGVQVTIEFNVAQHRKLNLNWLFFVLTNLNWLFIRDYQVTCILLWRLYRSRLSILQLLTLLCVCLFVSQNKKKKKQEENTCSSCVVNRCNSFHRN